MVDCPHLVIVVIVKLSLNFLDAEINVFCVVCSVLRLDNDGAVQVMLTTSRTAPASLASSSNPVAQSRLVSSAAVLPVSGAAAIAYGPANTKGFFDGVFGCLRPVLSFIGKTAVAELKQQGQC